MAPSGQSGVSVLCLLLGSEADSICSVKDFRVDPRRSLARPKSAVPQSPKACHPLSPVGVADSVNPEETSVLSLDHHIG